MALLALKNITLSFGGNKVLDSVNFEIKAGEVTGLIGPNGAGKTTAMNVITGFIMPDAGTVSLNDRILTGLPPHSVARSGIRRTFQTSLLCANLTVLENVMLGLDQQADYTLLGTMARSRRMQESEKRLRQKAMAALEAVGIPELAGRDGQGLSFGQQRLVELARAVAAEPQLLVLDEPAVGLTEPRIAALATTIKRLSRTYGMAVVLVEHVIQLVLASCDRVIVMNAGLVIAEGPAETVVNDPKVIESYLGRGYYAVRK